MKCLLPSVLQEPKDRGALLGGANPRGDFLYWDIFTWSRVEGGGGDGRGREVQGNVGFGSQPWSCGSSLPHLTVNQGSLFSEGGAEEMWSRAAGWRGVRYHREREEGKQGGRRAGLDVLTALHLWFVLSGLHLYVDHVVAGRHVTLLALWHLLLGDYTVDLWREGEGG